MLVSEKKLLQKARKEGYAVPAFNTSNLEVTLGIIRAAEKLSSPVILATSEGQIGLSNEVYLHDLLLSAAKQTKVPVAIHLDHGFSFEIAKRCIDAGYNAVHYDGSLHPYKKNVEISKKVVAYAKGKAIVEGELGHVFTPSSNNDTTDRTQFFTDPEKAKEYVKETGVDSLAISVGTAHGAYKGDTEIDFDRLKEIAEKVNVPLVLHGGSMVLDRDIKKAVRLGVSKINVNTEIRLVYTNNVREFMDKHPEEYKPERIVKTAIDEVQKLCEDKIKAYGSKGKG